MGVEEKIKEIEEEIRATHYNKSTEAHIGQLKAKLAKLKEESTKKGSSKKTREGQVKKSGDATAVIVGFSSVGKTTLFQKITNIRKERPADFSSLGIVPGILNYKGAKIQVLDMPCLTEGASYGKGRGKEILSIVRNADIILLVVDVFSVNQLELLKKELYNAAIRLNEKIPNVFITKRDRGGIKLNKTLELSIEKSTIVSILNEYKIHNADILIREDITQDQFIDVLAGNRKYIPKIDVINKIDLAKDAALDIDLNDAVFVSAKDEINIDLLRELIFDKLEFMRIYMKPQGEKPDFSEPMILKKNSTVGDICDRVHRDFRKKFKYAFVWGNSAKHDGQRVGLDHRLDDKDIVTIIVRK